MMKRKQKRFRPAMLALSILLTVTMIIPAPIWAADGAEPESSGMPAFFARGSAGEMEVSVSAPEGTFPEGTLMTVAPADEKQVQALAEEAMGGDFEVSDVKAVDISFYVGGEEVQPANGNTVRVELHAEEPLQGEIHSAVHVDGDTLEILGGAQEQDAEIEAESFSVYGIIGGNYASGETEVVRYTYVFKVKSQNGLEVVDSQIVTNGQQVTAPASPADKYFDGWRIEGETENTTFPITANIPESVKTDQVIIVEAHYEQAYYATFYKDAEKSGVLMMKDGKAGDTVTCDVTFKFEDGRAIIGWKVEGSDTPVTSVTFGTSDISLIPILSEEALLVTFDSRGGTPVNPVYVEKGQAVSAPAQPDRSGYTFKGWFTDEGCTQAYDFSTAVNGAFTLYAKWEGQAASYKIAHWLQNAEDDNYTLKEIEVKNSSAGLAASYTARSYEGFTLNVAKSDVTTLISGDGTTIKDVYYDRNTYSLTVNVKIGGFSVLSQWETKATYPFKYGQDTSSAWTAMRTAWPKHNWYTSESNAELVVFSNGTAWTNAPAMPLGGFTVWGKESNDSASEIQYYEDGTNNQIRDPFEIYRTGWSFSDEDYIDIPGFTYKRKSGPGYEGSGDNRKYVGKLYYTRNSYGLKMDPQDGSSVIAKDGIKYEASLSAYKPSNYVVGTTTHNFNGVTKTFAGWYDNAECVGMPFDFNGKMPALTAGTNLMLYGKWVAEMHTVSFDLDGGTFNGSDSISAVEAESGTQVTEPSGTLEKQDAVFGYWTLNGNRFSFDTAITRDITLVAHWNSDNSVPLRVVYNVNGGTGTFTDNTVYQAGSYAVIAGQPTPPANKVFTGWKVGESGVILAGGTFQVNTEDAAEVNGEKVVTLTAQYGDMPAHTTSVTYNLNGGNVGGSTENIVDTNAIINGNYTIIDTVPVKENYEFLGWSRDANATTAMFKAGETVAAGADPSDNILYAVWKLSVINITVQIAGKTKTEKYDGTTQTASGWTATCSDPGFDAAKVSYSGNAVVTGKNAGSYTQALDATKFSYSDAKYNATFTVTSPVTLDVSKRTVTLTSATDEKPYDGTPLTNSTVTVGGDGFANGEGASYNVTGSQLTVGSSDNEFTYTLNAGTSADNYNITETEGTLTVTDRGANKYQVSVTAMSGSFGYDATPHTVEGFEGKGFTKESDGTYTYAYKVNVNGTEVTFTVKGLKASLTQTNAGTYTVTPDVSGAKVYDAAGEEVTSQFAVTGKTGTLTISKASFSLTATGYSGKYDGTAHAGAVTVPDGISADIEYSTDGGSSWSSTAPTATHVADSKSNIQVKATADNYNDATASYDLTILPREVTLTSAGAEKPYDGTPLTKNAQTDVTVSGNGFVGEEGVASYNITGTQTKAGSSKNTFTYTLKDGTAAGDYTIRKVEGDLVVTAYDELITVTITGDIATSVYDGQAHTATGWQVSINAPAGVTYTENDFAYLPGTSGGGSGKPSVSQTDVGKNDMGLKEEQFENTSGNFSNVKFAVTDGYAEVTPKAVTVTAANSSKQFGAADPAFDANVTGLIGTETIDYSVTRPRAGTDEAVGTYKGAIVPAGDATQGNYTVTYVNGDFTISASNAMTLTVTPYTLTYETNGGQAIKAEKYDAGTTVTLNKTTTKEGFEFDGWYSDKDLKNRITSIKMDGNKTVYAGWTEKKPIAPVPDGLNSDDHIKYVEGYPDGTVQPNGNITRAETSTMVYRLLTHERRDEIFTAENGFSDVEKGHWFNKAVSSMAKGKYVEGYPNGSFNPGSNITRAEFVTILVRFQGEASGTSKFPDVPAGHWASASIAQAVDNGWIKGYEDGTFGPDRPITRAEVMTIMNRVLHRGIHVHSTLGSPVHFPDNMDKNAWYYYEIIEASNDHEYMGSHRMEHWTRNDVDYEYNIAHYERP